MPYGTKASQAKRYSLTKGYAPAAPAIKVVNNVNTPVLVDAGGTDYALTGGGTGAVTSVNEKTGAVVLTGQDIKVADGDTRTLKDVAADLMSGKISQQTTLPAEYDPTASTIDYNGQIVMYIGETEASQGLYKGRFYSCVKGDDNQYTWTTYIDTSKVTQLEHFPDSQEVGQPDYDGQVIQYVGSEATVPYHKGFFYICSKNAATGEYTWDNLDTQRTRWPFLHHQSVSTSVEVQQPRVMFKLPEAQHTVTLTFSYDSSADLYPGDEVLVLVNNTLGGSVMFNGTKIVGESDTGIYLLRFIRIFADAEATSGAFGLIGDKQLVTGLTWPE